MEAADAEAVSELITRAWEQTYTPIMGAGNVEKVTSDWHSPQKTAQGCEERGDTGLKPAKAGLWEMLSP